MNALREQLIAEIQYIPDQHLQEIFSIVHFFQLGLNAPKSHETQNVKQFAGAWLDMDDKVFAEWDTEWRERRHTAFSQRTLR